MELHCAAEVAGSGENTNIIGIKEASRNCAGCRGEYCCQQLQNFQVMVAFAGSLSVLAIGDKEGWDASGLAWRCRKVLGRCFDC